MMSSEAIVLALAILMLAAGGLSGWLLRGQFPGRSRGQRQSDAIEAGQEKFISRAARNGSRAGDIAARRGGFTDAIKTAHQDSADAATALVPIADKTAIPCVRNTFSLALSHRLAESARSGDPLSLILVRIDNYRGVRDRSGLQASNEILDAVGKFFIASVRGYDWVARFDTTTFAFLLPNTEHANALCVAERLRTTVSSAGLSVNGTPIPLTLSLGTTEAKLGDSSEAILRRAEEAMNASIQTGGNRIHRHTCGLVETACAG